METTALLVMDVQNGIVARVPSEADALLVRLGEVTAAARKTGIPVVHVRVAFRPDGADISPHNRAFSAIAASTAMGLDDPATQIHPAVGLRPATWWW